MWHHTDKVISNEIQHSFTLIFPELFCNENLFLLFQITRDVNLQVQLQNDVIKQEVKADYEVSFSFLKWMPLYLSKCLTLLMFFFIELSVQFSTIHSHQIIIHSCLNILLITFIHKITIICSTLLYTFNFKSIKMMRTADWISLCINMHYNVTTMNRFTFCKYW